MTTIVLAHPTGQHPKFQVYVVYDAPGVHRAFAAKDFTHREEAEQVAHGMMEEYEADHFCRMIAVGEAIG